MRDLAVRRVDARAFRRMTRLAFRRVEKFKNNHALAPRRMIVLVVHNIEILPRKGGQMVRSAGSSAQVMAHSSGKCTLKLPSGEIRMVDDKCLATIGQVGNKVHEQIISGKAGRTRWLGRRPKVRGVAMNPVDHPMGGGEGKSSGGRHPTTPWGKPTKGFKTRKKNKKSNEMIVKRRNG